MAVQDVTSRWERAGKAMRPDDRPYAAMIADFTKRHTSAIFYTFDDPLEAAVFSVLVEILKRLDTETDEPCIQPSCHFPPACNLY